LEALRGKFDLADVGARLPFVREAAKIIARSGSALTRQEYSGRLTAMIGRLSEEWYPGEPHRAMQARLALAQEVERLLRLDRMSPRPHMAPPAPAVAPAAPKTGRARAEEELLRAALTEDGWAEWIASRVTAEQFSGPRRRIAERLLGNNESGGPPGLGREQGAEGRGPEPRTPNAEGPTPDAGLAGRAEAIRNDPELAEMVSELLLQPAPISEDGLEQNLLAVERAWKEERKQGLQRAYAAGEIGPGDPGAQELKRLLVELGGSQRREE